MMETLPTFQSSIAHISSHTLYDHDLCCIGITYPIHCIGDHPYNIIIYFPHIWPIGSHLHQLLETTPRRVNI